MPLTLLKPARLLIAALAACLLLALTTAPAQASSWGTPQSLNSLSFWNVVSGRWTANNELETYTPNCVWYDGSTLMIKTYSAGGGVYDSGRVESKAPTPEAVVNHLVPVKTPSVLKSMWSGHQVNE